MFGLYIVGLVIVYVVVVVVFVLIIWVYGNDVFDKGSVFGGLFVVNFEE